MPRASARRSRPPAGLSRTVVPEISLVVSAKTPLGFSLPKFVAAAQRFVDEHLAPIWGVGARLRVRTRTRPGCWALVFVDTEHDASCDGWHDLTKGGMPLAKVFLRILLDDEKAKGPQNLAKRFRDQVTLTATHEIAEMLVDPATTLCVQRPGYGLYALEVADPVEEDGFAIAGFAMTDFVYPSWYEAFHKPRSTKFDHLGICSRPFELRKSGYASIYRSGRWSDHAGSREKRVRFAAEDRAGHRTELRKKRKPLERSKRR